MIRLEVHASRDESNRVRIGIGFHLSEVPRILAQDGVAEDIPVTGSGFVLM